tara:strand:- start:3928 stop:4368 length:441 start_codon:yes stop_codon:yes gene_type:complete
MIERQERWDKRFMDLAWHISGWSKDPRRKVGAVIVDSNRRILAMGYNGFPRGVDDDWRRYADRETKLSLVVHAELNAILSATAPLEMATLYVTSAPCAECAKAILQTGIDRVVWPTDSALASSDWAKSCEAMRLMFDEAGIDVEVL